MHCPLRARIECNPFKSFQLPDRPRSAARALVDVKLNHGIAGPFAGVGHVDRDIDRSAGPGLWSYS